MSNEIKVPIPSRVYNAATGGHVAGAEDIDFGQKVKHLVKYDHSGNEVSFASQLTAQNTIYVIHDDFTLTADVTIPSGCTLKFEGGSISGTYTISAQNTGIEAGLVKIFDTDITIAGTWNVTNIYSNWFGFVEGSQNDNKKQFLNLLSVVSSSVHNNIYIEDGTFYTSIVDSDFGFEIPSNTDVYNNAHICQIGTNRGKYAVFSVYDSENVTFRGGRITGDNEVHIGDITEHGHCIYLVGARNTVIENVICEKACGDGIDIQALYSDYENDPKTITGHCYNITIKNVTCDYNGRQGISVEGVIGCTIDTCTITNIGQGAYYPSGPWAGIDIEPWYAEELVRNLIISNCVIKNCKGAGIENLVKDQQANIIIENNNVEYLFLNGCEGGLKCINNIIGRVYAINVQDTVLEGNVFGNLYFDGASDGNILLNNTIEHTDGRDTAFVGCDIIGCTIKTNFSAFGSKVSFKQCTIVSEISDYIMIQQDAIVCFYNCNLTIIKPINLRLNAQLVVKNSILNRAGTDPLVIFGQGVYVDNALKLISNTYINAPSASNKVQNWGSGNPTYIISDIDNEVATVAPPKPYTGQSYFNGTKPVWWNGTAWVDATGTPV